MITSQNDIYLGSETKFTAMSFCALMHDLKIPQEWRTYDIYTLRINICGRLRRIQLEDRKVLTTKHSDM